MILVDTSVWCDHFRAPEPGLAHLAESGLVLIHPFVTGEIALGNMRRRGRIIEYLQRLVSANVATDDEVLDLIERFSLFGSGIGFIDAHLLAATRLTAGSQLWTRDKRLAAAAEAMGLLYSGRPVH